VIFGLLLYPVFLDISTIWLFWMIVLITRGPFRCAISLTRSPRSLTFSLMCPRSFVVPSGVSSATMDVSLTTTPLAPSSFLTMSNCGCRGPTRPYRMIRLGARFIPLTMSCAPYCSRLSFRLATGLRVITLSPTSSTFYPPRPSQPPPPLRSFQHHFLLRSPTSF
jgi:hypothetical protein